MGEQLFLPVMDSKAGETKKTDIYEDKDFTYDGYQVVRGGFFAHLFEPSVTLNREKISVNTACIRKLPEVEYVQFLVNPTQRKLAVKPCREDERDSFRWCLGEGKQKKPKAISCRIFYAKVMDLMGWDPEDRHKVLGKLVRAKGEAIFIFDLNAAETYMKKADPSKSRKALYPDAWKNQFGLPVNEHQEIIQVNFFNEHVVFRIDKAEEENAKKVNGSETTGPQPDAGHEETEDKDTQADVAPAE